MTEQHGSGDRISWPSSVCLALAQQLSTLDTVVLIFNYYLYLQHATLPLSVFRADHVSYNFPTTWDQRQTLIAFPGLHYPSVCY